MGKILSSLGQAELGRSSVPYGHVCAYVGIVMDGAMIGRDLVQAPDFPQGACCLDASHTGHILFCLPSPMEALSWVVGVVGQEKRGLQRASFGISVGIAGPDDEHGRSMAGRRAMAL